MKPAAVGLHDGGFHVSYSLRVRGTQIVGSHSALQILVDFMEILIKLFANFK